MKACMIVVALALLGVASARVIRDTTAVETWTQVEKDLTTFGSDFLKFFGFENEADFKNKAHEGGKKVADIFDKLAAEIKQKTEELKDNEAVKELNATLQKAVEEFKSKNPNAEGFINDANKNTEEIISKIKAIGESEDAKNIKELSKNLLDTTSKTLNKLRDEVAEAVKAKAQ